MDSKKIQRAKWASVVLAVGLITSLSLAIPAFAVTEGEDIGASVFELDGNLVTAGGTHCFPGTPSAGCSLDLPTDWADLFTTTGATFPLPTGALIANFSNDGGIGLSKDPTWFTSGNKDTMDISQWHCGSQTPSPAKDNIMNAYSVKFTISSGARAGHTILYMAFEREKNDGSSNNGFWILQDGTVKCNSNGSFTGQHKTGDLLVASLFTSGGSISSINVYPWAGGDGTSGHLDTTVTTANTGLDCSSTRSATANVCGIVNTSAHPAPTGQITTPWPSDAFGETGNTLDTSEFYEVGIDLTAFGFTNCSTTIMADTRASPTGTSGPLTADTKDFLFENLISCNTTTITKASQTGTVAPGTTVTDTANVTSASPGVGAPTGSVQFYTCGPFATSPDQATCALPANEHTLGTPVTLSPIGSTATSSAVSTGFAPNAAGYYCFEAVYTPTDGFRASNSTTVTNECFQVVVSTTTVTQSDNTGGNVIPGTSVSDTATVSDVSPGTGTPTGSVQFFFCGPSTTATSCSTSGSPTDTETLSAAGGTSATATSAAQAPVLPGFYCWSAVYVPATGSSFTGSQSTVTTNECFHVSQSIPKISAFGYANTPTNNDPTTGSGTVLYAVNITNYAKTPITLYGNLTVSGQGTASVTCTGGNILQLSGSVAAGASQTFSLSCNYSDTGDGDTVTAVLKAWFTDISVSTQTPVSGSPATSIFTIQKT